MKISVLVGTSWNSALRDAVKTSCNWRRCKRLQPIVGLVHVLVGFRRAAIQRGTPSCTLLVTALRMSWYAVLIECMSRRSEVGPPRLSRKGDGEQPSLLSCACVCCIFTRRKS